MAGFFSSLAKVTSQTKQMQKRMDMGATMAAAQASMAQASQFMAASTPVATTPAQEAQRLHVTATVASAQQMPMIIGMNSVIELELIVHLPGGVPLPVRRTEQLAPLRLASVAPGATVPVSIIPGLPETVRLEWPV